MTKNLVRIVTAVMTTLLAILVLWQFRVAIVYVLLSLILTAVLRPFANLLAGRRLVVRLSWILLFLAGLGGFGFLLFLTGRSALSEIQQLGQGLSERDAWTLPVWLKDSPFQQTLVAKLPPPSQLFEAVTGTQGQFILPTLFGWLQGIGGVLTGVFVILFLSIYWSINQIHFERLWLSLLPSDQRKRARGIWRTIEPGIGTYIRGQLFQSLLAGLFLGIGYWLLGSPYPVVLALAGALACLVPIVGAPLAVLPPLLVGLMTGLQLSLVMALYAIVVVIALGVWIKPRLFDRRWDNPILTIILLIALADAFGVVGILVAPPLSVVCQVLWNRLVSHLSVSGAAAQISDLKERLAHLGETISSMDDPRLPLVTSSIEQLAHLMVQAEPVLQAALPAGSSEPVRDNPPHLGQGNQNSQTRAGLKEGVVVGATGDDLLNEETLIK